MTRPIHRCHAVTAGVLAVRTFPAFSQLLTRHGGTGIRGQRLASAGSRSNKS